MTKTEYYITQADLAHDLYNKSSGPHQLVWMGAAKGFQTRISDEALFAECIEKATLILSK